MAKGLPGPQLNAPTFVGDIFRSEADQARFKAAADAFAARRADRRQRVLDQMERNRAAAMIRSLRDPQTRNAVLAAGLFGGQMPENAAIALAMMGYPDAARLFTQSRIAAQESADRRYLADKDSETRTQIADKESADRRYMADKDAKTRTKIAAKESKDRRYVADKDSETRTKIAAKDAKTRMKIAAKESKDRRYVADTRREPDPIRQAEFNAQMNVRRDEIEKEILANNPGLANFPDALEQEVNRRMGSVPQAAPSTTQEGGNQGGSQPQQRLHPSAIRVMDAAGQNAGKGLSWLTQHVDDLTQWANADPRGFIKFIDSLPGGRRAAAAALATSIAGLPSRVTQDEAHSRYARQRSLAEMIRSGGWPTY